GRFILESVDQRFGLVVRDRRVQRRCRLHRTRPYRTGLKVGPLTMVLPIVSVGARRPHLVAHRGRSGVAAAWTGWTRPFPRMRFTPLAIGVQRRTKKVARPGMISALGSEARSPAAVEGSPSRAV